MFIDLLIKISCTNFISLMNCRCYNYLIFIDLTSLEFHSITQPSLISRGNLLHLSYVYQTGIIIKNA